MPDYRYGPLGADQDDAVLTTLIRPLHFTASGTPQTWFDRIGRASFRILSDGERPLAGCAMPDFAMWYGGRAVPTSCINGVGVIPEARGTGAGIALMRAVLQELHARRVPLATLYPATLQFYQKAGFERAGIRQTFELPLSLIVHGPTEATLEPFTPSDQARVAAIYARKTAVSAGLVERPAWMWHDRLEPAGEVYRFIVREGGSDTGYIVLVQGGRADPLRLTDVCALTVGAARALLRLLAGYRTMVEVVTWAGGPTDPLLLALAENVVAGAESRVRLRRNWEWMLRLVDLPGAIAARGYPPGLTATLALEVTDTLLPENAGRWTLQIAAGSGRVDSGGAGGLRLDIRALAALYTGHLHPFELQAAGLLDGSAADLALLGAAFAGPRPWMLDSY